MAVITISRQYGSGGDEIAARLGEVLTYKHFDKRLLTQAAAETGLSEQEIFDYSEENHKVQGFLDRLFNRSSARPVGRIWREDVTGARMVEEVRLNEEVCLALVQKAIRSAVQIGDMIIVGRAGQVILKDEPGVINIRIEAPIEQRIQRVKEEIRLEKDVDNTDIELRRLAQDRIVERDATSADYLRRFYHADWDDPMHYHLVLNTGKLTIPQAVELITHLVKQIETVPFTPEPA